MAVTQQHTAVTGNVTAVLGLLCYLQYNNIFGILAMWNEFLWPVCVVIPEFIGRTEENHENLFGTGTTSVLTQSDFLCVPSVMCTWNVPRAWFYFVQQSAGC